MGLINPAIPTIGDLNATEDPDIRNALIAIIAEFNGNIDDTNVKSGANINGSKLLDNSVTPAKIVGGATGFTLVPQYKPATAQLNAGWGPTNADVTGCTFTTTANPGNYLIYASLDVDNPTWNTSIPDFVNGILSVGGAQDTQQIVFGGGNAGGTVSIRGPRGYLWHKTAVAQNTVIKLQVTRAGANNSIIRTTGTALTVIQYS